MADLEVFEDSRKINEDFLWLRYLEVENANPLATSSNFSRESKKFKKLGTTPFTLTKRLRKDEDEEYGFEINWSKPICIHSVTKNSIADKLEVGDFIIFVNNINVVDMNRTDIEVLLKQDDVLLLEIFRRAKTQMTVECESIPIDNNASKESASPHKFVDLSRNSLTHYNSIESTKKKQLAFRKEESICSSDDSQKYVTNKLIQNLVALERSFVDSLIFGQSRYIDPLRSRKDLISSKEHKVLFSNIETISAIMKTICLGRKHENLNNVLISYRKELPNFIEAYDNYFSLLKTAETIVVDKTHHRSFSQFLASPTVQNHQTLFHSFIQKPMDFYDGLQKQFQIILGQCKVDGSEYKDLSKLLLELQTSYQNAITKTEDSIIEIKPLLKTLDSRLVFTKCKPFCLDIPGRTFIFAGDLLRIEKDKEFPTYALLFNDILVFSTINRDRVLFITEEPISLKFVTDSFFNIRKKENEFRLLVETNPLYKDLSPTTRCTPDIIRRSPLREQSKKRTIFLRAHSEDVKKVWQNLITQSVLQLHSSTSTTSFLEPQSHHFNSNQTELTSTKIETDLFFSPSKAHYRNNAFINQLSLKTQNTFDLRESLENLNVDEPESFPETPETPSCANLSHLNEKLHESLSFSSSFRNESCEGIFDFDCDLFTSEVCNESIFCNDDPFFVDE